MELFKLFGTLAINGTQQANRELDEVSSKAEKSENRMSAAFKKIGAAVAAAFAVDRIKAFGTAIVDAAAEVAAEEAAFTQIMGEFSDQAAAKVEKIADATGMVDSRLTPYMTSMTAKFKGLGFGIDEATDLASTGLNIAADAAAFWDKSLADSMGALNSFVNGNYEGGEAIGLFANETTLATWASENLGYTWKDLTEKEKQFARLEFAKAMQEASGAAGQAAKESGAYQNVMGNLTEAWRQFKAQIGEPLLQNIVIPAMKWLGDFITNTLAPKFEELKEKVKTLSDYYKEHKTTVENVATAVGVLATAIFTYITYVKNAETITKALGIAQKAWAVISGILTGQITLQTIAQKALNTAMKANPIGAIIALIVALVGALVLAYQKNEDFRNAVNELWKEIKDGLQPTFEALKPLITAIIDLFKNVWSLISASVIPIFNQIITVIAKILQEVSPILSALLQAFNACFKPIIEIVTRVVEVIGKIVGAITKAVEAVRNGIQKIKDFFKFKFEWPKLKLPRFSIKPEGWKIGDLFKGVKPKLGITWAAEGGIFDSPTLFNTPTGMLGVGEAGAEAVAPIDKLAGYVQTAVQSETSGLSARLEQVLDLLANFFPQVLQNMGQDIVLDDGALVGRIAPKINARLGDIQKANARGR